MGLKWGLEKIEKVKDKLYVGMVRCGFDVEVFDCIYV